MFNYSMLDLLMDDMERYRKEEEKELLKFMYTLPVNERYVGRTWKELSDMKARSNV